MNTIVRKRLPLERVGSGGTRFRYYAGEVAEMLYIMISATQIRRFNP